MMLGRPSVQTECLVLANGLRIEARAGLIDWPRLIAELRALGYPA